MTRTIDAEREIVIYIGTRKLAALAGTLGEGEPRIAGYAAQLHPEGFKNGLVTSLEKAGRSIGNLLQTLFTSMGQPGAVQEKEIEVNVVLGNSKLRTFTYSSSEYYQGARRIISTDDVRSVVEQTRSVVTLPLTEYILQVLPVSFLVNDLEDVANPIGLEAQRLGVTLKMFTMDQQDYKNIAKAFEGAEVSVKGFWPKMLTASEAALTEQEKNEGVLLIDIAHEITTLAVWKKGELVNTKILNLGSKYLSSEIAAMWEIEISDADKVKEHFGNLEKSIKFGEELIPLVSRNEKGSYQISRQAFQEKFLEMGKGWLGKILEDANSFARDEKTYHPHYVFTGGGTCLDGFLEFVQSEFKCEGRIGHTRKIDTTNDLLVNPSLTAALGAFNWLNQGGSEKMQLLEPQGIFQKTFTAAIGWFSAYF